MNHYCAYIYGASATQIQLPFPHICFDDQEALFEKLETETCDYVLVASAEVIDLIDIPYIISLTQPFELLHGGLKTGMRNAFEEMQITALSWFFLNPDETVPSVSWKADSQFFIINPRLLDQIGGIDFNYESWEARVADLSYRLLRNGGKVFHDPQMVREASWSEKRIPQADLFRFIIKHINTSAAAFYLLYAVLSGNSIIRSIQNFRKTRGRLDALTPRKANIWSQPASQVKSVGKYSVIIPTLDRYGYLPQAVQSLLDQGSPPDDIVVYDQTPADRRNTDWNAQFPSKTVRVIFSDRPGQSTARNEALKNTRHEWCLLFDDDSLAMPAMVANHIKLVEHSNFFVSTGSSLAPQQSLKDLPYDVDFLHLTDVLDTGNCFIHKSIWQEAGGFDPAFDRGPGADNDFGTRIYLKGVPVVFNNKAVRIHYKATSGGLRSYGVWWRFKTDFNGPYPPPSQTYTIRKYYARKFWPYHYFRFYLKASYRNNVITTLLLWLLLPFKLYGSIQAAKKLKSNN